MLHERMDELGIDFAVLYPTNTLLTCAETDPDLRRGPVRAGSTTTTPTSTRRSATA